jgi:menaquinone-dependent protoporphyrinogen IX oxidase
MKIRLYLDEDAMAEALVQALTERGIDVTTANLENMVFRPDPEHLAYATSIGRVLYSFNVGDYCQLHGEWLSANQPHAGIIVASQQRFSIGEQMRRLLRLTNTLSAEAMQNRLEFLGNWD